VVSHNALFVVFKFHDDRLNVLALSLPLVDALLRVGVEVFFLLVEQGLGLEGGFLVCHELLRLKRVLLVVLILDEVGQFHVSCTILLLLLLLSKRQLVVADAPELSKLFLFLLLLLTLLLLALNLECTAAVDGGLHFSLFPFVFLKQTVSLVFSLGNLLVQNSLSIVLECLQLCNLRIDHLLSLVLLLLEFLLFTFFFHVIKLLSLLVVLLNFLGLRNVPKSFSLLLLHLLLVHFRQVSPILCNLFESLEFLHFFTFQVLLCLALDELAFKHLFLDLLDVPEFEVF
jgi:hypothetical protein